MNLGQTFDLPESIAALQTHAGSNKIIDINGVKIRDRNGQDYGDGVTRQWINQVCRSLLTSDDLFVESDAGVELAISSLKAAGNDDDAIAAHAVAAGKSNADVAGAGAGAGAHVDTGDDVPAGVKKLAALEADSANLYAEAELLLHRLAVLNARIEGKPPKRKGSEDKPNSVAVDDGEEVTAPLRQASLKAVAKVRFRAVVETIMANSASNVAAATRTNESDIPTIAEEGFEEEGGGQERDHALDDATPDGDDRGTTPAAAQQQPQVLRVDERDRRDQELGMQLAMDTAAAQPPPVCLERTLAVSPLSEMKVADDLTRMIAVGRFLALALLRNEPVGVSIAPSTLKLLLGQPQLVNWQDLAQVLPELQFGCMAACLEHGLSAEEQGARFDLFRTNALGLFPGDDEIASFQMPSREARRYASQLSRNGSSEESGAADAPANVHDDVAVDVSLDVLGGGEDVVAYDSDGGFPPPLGGVNLETIAAATTLAPEAPEAPAPARPMRLDSQLDDAGAEHEVTSQNVNEFASAWAHKELVVNTEDQIKAVLQGFADVKDGQEFLAALVSEFGVGAWKEMQRLIRGSTEIDVEEWKLAVNVTTSGEISAAKHKAVLDCFWRTVQMLPQASKQKLLYYWTSMLPPAGGM